MIKVEKSFLVSSDTDAGAINVSSSGDRFSVQWDSALKVPANAFNVQLSVVDGTVWYVQPNIREGVNDKFYLHDGDTLHTLTVDEGLYGYIEYNAAIQRALVNLVGTIANGAGVIIGADQPTGKTTLTISGTGGAAEPSVDFTGANTARLILGWDSGIVGPTTVDPEVFTSDNIAQFNVINYYLVHTDLVPRGMRFNNSSTQIIARVMINVQPNKQVLFEPRNPAIVSAETLKGAIIGNVQFWITNEDSESIDMASENWSMRFLLSYLIPMKSVI